MNGLCIQWKHLDDNGEYYQTDHLYIAYPNLNYSILSLPHGPKGSIGDINVEEAFVGDIKFYHYSATGYYYMTIGYID